MNKKVDKVIDLRQERHIYMAFEDYLRYKDTDTDDRGVFMWSEDDGPNYIRINVLLEVDRDLPVYVETEEEKQRGRERYDS